MGSREDERGTGNLDDQLLLLGTFALGVAHDLKNPLFAIEILARDALDSADPQHWRTSLERIRDAGARCQRAIAEISTFVTQDVLGEHTVDLGGILSRCVERIGSELPTLGPVDVHVDREGRFVRGNGPALEIALGNLIRNAAQARSNGCHVSLRCERRNDRIILTCTDDGPGIPEAVIEQVFRHGGTLRDGDPRGTGLGLPIAHRILLAHGARLRIEPSRQGTTCTVEFPLPEP
jgi:signal transduction histidine kinase